MRQLFISYARENKPDVEALIRDLDALGYQTWVDSSLRGGQTWWEEILRRIAESDVFVAIVSAHTLNSVACQRELEWALALNKPVLPVAVERLPQALPLTLSTRQIVDYSKPGKKAASALAGALGTLPAEPPAPEQLPEPPPAPLSYLSDLMEQVGQPEPLTHAQQHQILIQLQPALRSADPEEREGGRYVLKMFSSRDDLYADVDRTLAQLELADHLDVAARLEQAARTAQRRKALVDEMTALHQAGQWDAVVAAAQELAGLDPEHPDPGGIVSDAQAKIRDAQLAEQYAQAWAQAADLFSAIEQEQPGYRDAAALLKTAEQQRDLAGWLDQAEAAAGHDDWDTAVTALENLCAVDPAYRDAGARLEQARSARSVKQRRSLVDEMTALHQAGRWKEVLAAAEKLAQLDPDHPDPGGIVSDAQAKIRDAQLAEQYAQALNHLDQQHWQQAVEVFTAIEQEQPGYRDAAALLKTAEQQRDLAGWLDQAEAAAGHDDWDTAVTALENLCAVDPAYRHAGARLEQARSARSVKQRRSLVDEMTALHQAGRWKEVLAAAEKLAQLDPDHPDPGGIVSDAQAKIRDAQLAEQYAQALNHLDQQHWQQAAEVFTAIEQEQPGYRDAAALLKTADQQRDLAGWLDQAEAAAGHEDWDTAVTALENLCAVDPAYRHAGARLEQARSARSVKQRRSLVDEMTALHQAGRWKEVLAAAEKLAQLDPDHPDPGGIVSDAQAKIRDAQLAEQYAQALNHLDQQHWQQAAEVFTAIEQEQPGYRDATSLLKTAQQQRQLAGWLDQAEAAAGHEDWDTAVTALENLCAVDPAYRHAGARLEQARSARLVKQRRCTRRRDDRTAPGRAVERGTSRRRKTRPTRPRPSRPGRDRFRRASQDPRRPARRAVCAGTQPPRPTTLAAGSGGVHRDRAGATRLPRCHIAAQDSPTEAGTVGITDSRTTARDHRPTATGAYLCRSAESSGRATPPGQFQRKTRPLRGHIPDCGAVAHGVANHTKRATATPTAGPKGRPIPRLGYAPATSTLNTCSRCRRDCYRRCAPCWRPNREGFRVDLNADNVGDHNADNFGVPGRCVVTSDRQRCCTGCAERVPAQSRADQHRHGGNRHDGHGKPRRDV